MPLITPPTADQDPAGRSDRGCPGDSEDERTNEAGGGGRSDNGAINSVADDARVDHVDEFKAHRGRRRVLELFSVSPKTGLRDRGDALRWSSGEDVSQRGRRELPIHTVLKRPAIQHPHD